MTTIEIVSLVYVLFGLVILCWRWPVIRAKLNELMVTTPSPTFVYVGLLIFIVIAVFLWLPAMIANCFISHDQKTT
jgi:hypothetical protein